MALSAARNTAVLGAGGIPVKAFYPVAASTIIYEGALVALDTAGNLVPGSISTTLKAAGIALATVDNSAGAAAALFCEVGQGVAHLTNSNSMTKASVGALAYIVDDASVSSSSNGSTRSIAGTVYLVDSTGVWVYVGLSAPVDATALTAAIAAYAATTTGAGASLIGVEDSGTLYTATQVEAALAEVMKVANAANAKPVTGSVYLAAATTLATVMRFVPTFAGKIDKLDAWMTAVVTAASKSLTLSTYISGVLVTGGVINFISAGCLTLGNRISGTSATGGNAFTAGQEITVVQSGAITAFTEGEIELALFIKSA
jgi:hypothetical protein